MKKFLPIILFLIGLLVVGGAFIFVKARSSNSQDVEVAEEVVAEVSFENRPVASLTPSEDGHWLALKVEKIVIDAASMDYELLYRLPDGRTQGVPGTIKLKGQKEIERKLLLGSESSGKFRYDEGVSQGMLTLRFRNEKGKLIAKFATEFHLQSKTNTIDSVDGVFEYDLDKTPKNVYFVTMQTFGVYKMPAGDIVKGPYGIFASVDAKLSGKVKLDGEKVYLWSDGQWEILEDNKASGVGIFISTQ